MSFQTLPTEIDNGHLISILQVKKSQILQSVKFPLSRKFTVDNSEYHAITVTKKRLKTYKVKVLFIQGSVFLPVKSKLIVYCCRLEPKILDMIRQKRDIYRIIESFKKKK